MFRYLVLGLLRDGRAYHGYALMKAYRDRSGVSISTGNFYRELQRLVGEGLVQTAPVAPGEDARRAPYQVTEQGMGAFDSWVVSPPTHIGSYDDELSSRAVFIGEADPLVAQRLLEGWREAVWIHGKTLEREREMLLAKFPGRTNGFDARTLLLARRLKHVAADLEFIDELRRACRPPEAVQAIPVPVPLPLEASVNVTRSDMVATQRVTVRQRTRTRRGKSPARAKGRGRKKK